MLICGERLNSHDHYSLARQLLYKLKIFGLYYNLEMENPVFDQPEWLLYNLARAYQSILNLVDADSANLGDCFALVGALSDIDIQLGSSGEQLVPTSS